MDFIKALLNIMGGGQIEEAEKKQQQNQQSVQAGSKTQPFANVEDKPEPSRKNKGFDNMVSNEALREWGWEPQENGGGITSWQPSKNQASEEDSALSNAVNKIESGQSQAEGSEEAPITGWDGTQLYTPEQIAKPKVSTEGSSKEVREINPNYAEPKGGLTYGDLPLFAENGVALPTDYDVLLYNATHPGNLRGGAKLAGLAGGEDVSPSWDWYSAIPELQAYTGQSAGELERLKKFQENADMWGNEKTQKVAADSIEKYLADSAATKDNVQSFIDSRLDGELADDFNENDALEKYFAQYGLTKNGEPSTDSTGVPDNQGGRGSGADANQGTAETNQDSDAIVEQAAAENYYRPIGMETAIQGDLADAFRKSLDGNEAARNYYTDVSSKIYEYYQDAFLMANGYDAPYNNLFDFCMHCTPDEFWEYAQFTHSYFGMYTGPEFDNPDGTLNEQAIYDFYNNCKSAYTISRVLGMDEDVIGAFISDYKTAQDLATYLISSGYASPNENFAQGLWAANVVGDATSQDPYRNKDQGRDTWQDAYDQLENSGVQIGGYEEGGRFSAQGRLLENPYNDWTDENRYAIPYNILNDEDALSYLDDWQKIADSIAYSQGWGFDRGR